MASRLFYGVLLALVLSVLWLLLSGYWFKPLLVGFGVLAVVVAKKFRSDKCERLPW